MKNIVDVIKQKEREIHQKRIEVQQLENEIEILRTAARLLSDDDAIAVAAASRAQASVPKFGNGEVKQFP